MPTYVNPQTGERKGWDGQGWVDLPPAAPSADLQAALDQARARAPTLSRVADLGQQFIGYNQKRGTGGVGSDPLVPSWFQPNRQAMTGLTSEMLSALIVPGQSKSLDSNKEMEFAQARLPNVQTAGPINQDRVRRMKIDRDVMNERIKALEAWAASGKRTLQGFEAQWAPREQQLRSQLWEYYRTNAKPIEEAAPQERVMEYTRDGRLVAK